MSLKLYSWNVNGLRAVIKKGALQALIDKQQPDILCLQETKAGRNQIEIDLDDYHEFWHSAERAGYSGTAIFSKIRPLKTINGLVDGLAEKYHLTSNIYGDPTREGRVINLELADFWVVTVYTPNAKDDLSRLNLRYRQWDPAFLEHLQTLEKTKPVLFCGDLNVAHQEIDLANPKANTGRHGFTDEERAGFENYLRAGFIDTFRTLHPDQTKAYTWWTHWANARARNIGWRIDYWLTSRALIKRVTAADIHPNITGSDHCPISLVID